MLKKMRRQETFHRVSARLSNLLGSPQAFLIACLGILIWVVTGPIFHYSDTWQLVANTVTNVITFLMVFILQNTQNRDAKAIHLKLDEIIRSAQFARNELLDLEDLSDEELDRLQKSFVEIREKARGPKGPEREQ